MNRLAVVLILAPVLLSIGSVGCYTRLATSEEDREIVEADTSLEAAEEEREESSAWSDEDYWDARARFHLGFHFYYPWPSAVVSYYDPWYWDYHVYSPWYGWWWPSYSWYYGSYYAPYYYRPYYYYGAGYYPYFQPVIYYYPGYAVAGRSGIRNSGIRRTDGERGISTGRTGSEAGRFTAPPAGSSSSRSVTAPRSRAGTSESRDVRTDTRRTAPSGRGDRAVAPSQERKREQPATRSAPGSTTPRRESTTPPSRVPERRPSGESRSREQSSGSSAPAPSYRPAPSAPPSGGTRSAPPSSHGGSEGRSGGSRRSR